MNDLQIIKTDVVTCAWDTFWNDLPESAQNATPKPVLVIMNAYEPGSDTEETFNKLMSAGCLLSSGQYNVVQLIENQKIAWHKLKSQCQPKYVLLFGIMPTQLGIASLFVLNERNSFDDCVIIPSLAIPEWLKQPQSKGHFWANIKPIFVEKKYGEI